ncbi:hypothetical protein BU23DRAFT_625859 [Bimuria novae-zelandiae CBS 107.79]|uniref:Uncharacterized protein n=1 Tax=Bimuria novae-zelandiae CBS 107.79 TaxID=1447943 RepID=A0A6A5VU52_9PLEO|nr:hypothetical protein BU23DRAFT_625859 [Bimuria novae-zelandiae CBS 107.79]
MSSQSDHHSSTYISTNQDRLSAAYTHAVQLLQNYGIEHMPGATAAFFLWLNLGKGGDVPGIVQGNVEGKRSWDGDVRELVDNFRQYDRRDQLNVAAVRLGIQTSVDIFEVAQREHDNNRIGRGSGVRRAKRRGRGSASVGVFKLWSSGQEEEIVDGAEASLGQREGDEDVAKVLSRINKQSQQYIIRSLGMIASADIFEAVQKAYKEAGAQRDTQGNGAAIGRDGSVWGDAIGSGRTVNNAGIAEHLGYADVRDQQNAMCTSPRMRTLGEVFDEAMREHSEARVRGIPKGTRRLAEVFDEAKREGEEVWEYAHRQRFSKRRKGSMKRRGRGGRPSGVMFEGREMRNQWNLG